MNILEMNDLGYAGVDILENLKEIREAVMEDKIGDGRDDVFEDLDHKYEYINDTIDMIIKDLTKLKSK